MTFMAVDAISALSFKKTRCASRISPPETFSGKIVVFLFFFFRPLSDFFLGKSAISDSLWTPQGGHVR